MYSIRVYFQHIQIHVFVLFGWSANRISSNIPELNLSIKLALIKLILPGN